MIKFFRKIRQNLLSEGKIGKYFKYAIGEIVLVVIGILLALSINDWYAARIQKANINDYYERIIIELNQEIISAEMQKKQNAILIGYNKRALKILDSKNLDSLSVLKDLLGATSTNWPITYSFPVTNEFLKQNYLSKINNDSLKSYFKYFTLELDITEGFNNYNNLQYHNMIEPFFTKNINYAEVALKQYKKNIIIGGPKTNFEPLFESLELWNILTFKLESLQLEYQHMEGTKKVLKLLKSTIEKELKEK
ncbi:hypothetical protein [Polaribacter aestuariivivens]|uniref:hypothetical protein n=1 Tax=Polaribacter aestuariivivens TaxID=2304626 RepID=UPI003F49AC02